MSAFAVAIDLLTGRYTASTYNDRGIAEWPPHPARVYSACVATWAEHGTELPDEAGTRAALEWLAMLPAPDVIASPEARVARRSVTTYYVPVNDQFVVSPPDRSKLDAALLLQEQAADEFRQRRAANALERERTVFAARARAAIAAPERVTNDALKVAASLTTPELRGRQPRTFPTVVPEVPVVVFAWEAAQEAIDRYVPLLAPLFARVVRLGHSSSLVRISVLPPGTQHLPSQVVVRLRPDAARGHIVLRWIAPGQLARLEEAHARHQGEEPRVLPARFFRYGATETEGVTRPATTHWHPDAIVFERVGGPRLPSVSSVGLSRQLRRALMSVCDEPIPPLISGHEADGSPVTVPHLAVVPLPFVGQRHADGRIMGVALMVPRETDEASRISLLSTVGRLERIARDQGTEDGHVALRLSATDVLTLRRIKLDAPASRSVDVHRWCGPSYRWVSVTPVALDRNPGDLHDPDPERRAAAIAAAEATVRDAVAHAAPDAAGHLVDVEVHRSALLPGSEKPLRFPRFPVSTARPQRVLVHVRLRFHVPVLGPMLLGAGRYHGLGLCLPLDETGDTTGLDA